MTEAVPAPYPRPIQARATVRGVIALQLLANGAGMVAVFLFLSVVFPEAAPTEGKQADLNAMVFGLYVLATLLIAVPINKHFLMKAMRWVRDGRTPTPIERWATLSQPLQQTFSAFGVWLGAAIIFGVVNGGGASAWRVALGIVLAGLITCSLLELLLDRRFRPVFALALVDARLPRWRREILTRLMLAWMLGSAVPLIAIGLAPIGVPADQLEQWTPKLTVLVIVGVLAGGLVMWAAAGTVSRPIEGVTQALSRVEQGDLATEVPVSHIGEIGRLQSGFNAMITGLRERRRLQDLFGRQVGVDVAREALEHDPELGGEAREITALFVDLDDFTSFSEQHTPEEVVADLNAFFAVVIGLVMAEGGWVNKFEGDAALCIFGAPGVQDDHAARALRAAAALPSAVAVLPRSPRVGIGVATGRVVAGNIGTAERYEYTVIGDAVNVAARLTELAKHEYDGVLASEETICAAGAGGASWHEVGLVVLRGRTKPTRLFAAGPVAADVTAGAADAVSEPTASPA